MNFYDLAIMRMIIQNWHDRMGVRINFYTPEPQGMVIVALDEMFSYASVEEDIRYRQDFIDYITSPNLLVELVRLRNH